jgi:hypothetical protein
MKWFARIVRCFRQPPLPISADDALLIMIARHGWPDADVLRHTVHILRDREEIYYQAHRKTAC